MASSLPSERTRNSAAATAERVWRFRWYIRASSGFGMASDTGECGKTADRPCHICRNGRQIAKISEYDMGIYDWICMPHKLTRSGNGMGSLHVCATQKCLPVDNINRFSYGHFPWWHVFHALHLLLLLCYQLCIGVDVLMPVGLTMLKTLWFVNWQPISISMQTERNSASFCVGFRSARRSCFLCVCVCVRPLNKLSAVGCLVTQTIIMPHTISMDMVQKRGLSKMSSLPE